LHGTYDAFSDSLVGVGIAVLSIVVFVAYYRSGEVLQGKLTALLQGTPVNPLVQAAAPLPE
jgi:Na+-transporting methylmalonyl-CoA/oxaloacetate decarboxylase beta subunit